MASPEDSIESNLQREVETRMNRQELMAALQDGSFDDKEREQLEANKAAILDFLAGGEDPQDTSEREEAMWQAIQEVVFEDDPHAEMSRDDPVAVHKKRVFEWLFGLELVKEALDQVTYTEGPRQLFTKTGPRVPPLLKRLQLEYVAAYRGTTAIIFQNDYQDLPYAEKILEKAVRQLARWNPDEVMSHVQFFQNKPFAKELVEQVLEKYPGQVLSYADILKDQPWADEIMEKAARAVLTVNPDVVLTSADIYKERNWASKIIEEAAERKPELALKFAHLYKDQPWAANIIKKTVDGLATQYFASSPSQVSQANLAGTHLLGNAEAYEDQDWAKDLIEKVARRKAEEDPRIALAYAYHYVDQPYAGEIIGKAAKEDPASALEYANLYIKQPYAEAILIQAAEQYPSKAVQFHEGYMDAVYGHRIFIQAVLKSPRSALVFPSKIKALQDLLSKGVLSTDTRISQDQIRGLQWIVTIGDNPDLTTDEREKAILLLADLMAEKIKMKDVKALVQDEKRYFGALIQVKGQNTPYAEYDLERTLSFLSLNKVREINDLHEASDALRFQSVKNFSASELYTLMIYSEEEIFTSSFSGLFTRLLAKMKSERKTGDDVLAEVGSNRFRTFIRLCANFNKLSEFLDTMEEASRLAFLEKFLSEIEKEHDPLAEAVTIADTFSTVRDPALLHLFQEILKREYERVKTDQAKTGERLYGLLAGMFGEEAVFDTEWYQAMGERYQIENVMSLANTELFNSDNSNVQQYFFYNDADGKASYSSFLAQYQEKGWESTDKGKYIVLSRSEGTRRVEMYANKPEFEDDGPAEIESVFEEKNISTIVVVHRGHSYHALRTIERITPRVRIVFLGSCGGYRNVSEVLSRSETAHILSTKGTGTMTVNDPLLKMLNNEILSGDTIDWSNFWREAEIRLGHNPAFQDYVAPHKNLGVMFIKAYQKLRAEHE